MNRPRPADWLAGIGGVVLLGSLWLNWYGLDVGALAPEQERGTLGFLNTFTGPPQATAWQAFSVTDILLAIAALLAIGVPLTSALAKTTAKPVAFTVLSSCGGAIAVLLVLYRIVNQPGSNELLAVKAGAWIGLAGAILTLVGSWLAMADETTPGAVPPQVPLRPAP
jgi:hypothetical protein